MSEARLLSVFDMSKLVKEMKTMKADLTAMSENIMKTKKKTYKKTKRVSKMTNNLDLLKVSKKWLIFLTCSKSAKWILFFWLVQSL